MVSRFYNDTVTLLKLAETTDTGGEILKTYSTYCDIIGSFQTNSGQWSENNDILAYRKTKTFYCDVSYQINDYDMIRYNSIDYEIIDVANQFGHHLEVSLQKRST